MEPTIDDIQPLDSREYKAENIEKEEYKIFFQSCEDMSEIPDNSVHNVFTSPPYFLMRGTVPYDSYVEYLDTMYTILKEMYRTVKPGRNILINISDYMVSEQLDKEIIQGKDIELGEKYDVPSHFSYLMYKLNQHYADHHELQYRDTIVWKKSGSTSQRAGTFVDSGNPLKYSPEEVTERILVFRKGDPDYERIWKEKRRSEVYSDVNMSTYEKFEEYVSEDVENLREYIQNVWEIQPETNSDHPAPYPKQLPRVAMRLYTVPREIVLDPFIGSATTVVAGQELNRKVVGYENLEAESDDTPDFVDMIKDRTGADSATLDQFQ
jgi:site-specific DNA-methyltransferase (adenine-specific)